MSEKFPGTAGPVFEGDATGRINQHGRMAAAGTTGPISESDVTPDAIGLAISTVLRYGIFAAAFVILFGVVLYVIQGGVRPILVAPPGVPPGVEEDPRSLRMILDRLGPGQPASVTDFGLLLLIVTPIFAVIVSGIAFARDRDWLYVTIAGFVLAMLLIGFLIGRA